MAEDASDSFCYVFWIYVRAMDTATATPPATSTAVRWSVDAVAALFDLPFNDLIYRAQTVHREHFDPNAVQRSTLLSIKTGGCPEDCGYCPQAARYHTGVENEDILSVEKVVAAAQCGLPLVRREMAAWQYNGWIATRGARSWVVAPSGIQRCSDGHVFVSVIEERQWRNLCELMGTEALIDDPPRLRCRI